MGKFIAIFLILISNTISAETNDSSFIISLEPNIIQVNYHDDNGSYDTLVFDSTSNNYDLEDMNLKSKLNLGESFKYEISWGFITAGWAIIKIDSTYHQYRGRKCYKIYSIGYSAKKVDFMGQKVRDTSFVMYDVETHRPLMFKKIINEGSYHRKRTVYFDHNNKTALYKNKLIKISNYTQDILGVIFMTRNLDLKIGKSLTIDVVDDGKFYSLKTEVLKKEKIKTDYGKYETYKVEPFLQSNGIFKNDGKMWIWFTNDEKKIPLMIKAKVALGSIKVRLLEYKEGFK